MEKGKLLFPAAIVIVRANQVILITQWICTFNNLEFRMQNLCYVI